MITYKKGNLWDSKADAIVVTVNCEGVAGAGVALDFKNKFPYETQYYQHVCNTYGLLPGRCLPIRTNKNPFWIICFSTKDQWKNPSQIEWIKEGLAHLVSIWPTLEIKSIAIPPLGCGLGKLNWKEVKELMEQYLSNLPGEVEIYEPARKSKTAK